MSDGRDERRRQLDRELAEILADALVADYLLDLRQRAQLNRVDKQSAVARTGWMTAKDAAAYARVSVKLIYGAVSRGQLRAAKIGAGRTLRFRNEWIDRWMEGCSSDSPAGRV